MDAGRQERTDSLEWTISVPIFRNPIILRQLGIAVGIPFGLVCMVLLLVNREQPVYAFYALGLLAALLALTYLLIMLLNGGRYAAGYKLDEKGILNYTEPRQARRNKVVNGLTVLAGLAAGKPAAMGAGMLAGSRQAVMLPWRGVRKVRYVADKRTIMLRGSPFEAIAVFCDETNYSQVQAYIAQRVRAPQA